MMVLETVFAVGFAPLFFEALFVVEVFLTAVRFTGFFFDVFEDCFLVGTLFFAMDHSPAFL